MGKLIKICQLFGCSLDNLVQGDVSRCEDAPHSKGGAASYACTPAVANVSTADADKAPRCMSTCDDGPVEPARSRICTHAPTFEIPAGPVTDVCGYEEHMVAFARKVALGIVLIILGAAVSVFIDEVMHADGIVVTAPFAFVVTDLGFLIPAGMNHATFVQDHPYVAVFYTEEQKTTARRRASTAIAIGLALILFGVALAALFEVESSLRVYGDMLMLVIIAFGVGAIIHWSMHWSRKNLVEYNKEWLETVELSDEELASLDASSREAYVRADSPRYRRAAARKKKACAAIMLGATALTLVWLFVGDAMGAGEDIGGLF